MGNSVGAGLVYADRIVHEGGRNVSYDLLGTHSEFRFESEYVYYVSGTEQVINLPYPSFVLCPNQSATRTYGIKVEYYEPTTSKWVTMDYDTSSSSTEISAGKWREVAEDPTAMAKAHYLWNDATYTFNGVLANQIKIKLDNVSGSTSTNYNVKVTYQAFYKDIVECDRFRTQTGPQYSRELGQNILDRLDILENRTRVMNRNMFGSVMYSNDILNEDLTGVNPDNRVEYELHEVDTSTGHTLISPTQGSFYPGVVNSQTAFKLCRYNVEDGIEISEQEVSRGTHLGWLFIFTLNAHQVYTVTNDTVYLDKAAYYKCFTKTGAYKRLVKGTVEEMTAGTADYALGFSTSYVRSKDTTVDSYKAYYTLNVEKKEYTRVVVDPTSTDNPFAKGWYEQTEVYLRENVAYDPDRKAFDSVVNDTSARISKEMRVILTRDNISKYTNYKGKCVDVSFTTLYKVTSDTTFQDVTVYYMRSVQTDGTYKYVSMRKGTQAQVEAGEADYYVGQTVPTGAIYVADGNTQARELALGVDYEFCDVNVAKTEQTYIDQPVYDHVRLLTPLTTDEAYLVGVSYQAFGGQVRPDDVRNLRNDVKNALTVLGEHQLLTVENLDKQVVIKDLIARLRRMENYHFHFHQVDHQVYRGGSKSTISGSETPAGFHWISIAQLYDVAWLNEQDFVQEIGTFRVYSKLLKWCHEFTVSVDLSKTGGARMVVKSLGATTKSAADPTQLATIANKENLFIRLCWNETNKKTKSGLVLQLGWDYSIYNYKSTDDWLTDTITVTNKSGNTSHWSLFYDPLETTKYTDAAINAYGHVKYVKLEAGTRISDTSIPYFTPVTDYLYYLATTTYAVSGVKYYVRDQGSMSYVELSVRAGTKLSDLGVTIYERSAYRSRYVQTSVTSGYVVTETDDIWKIDTSISYTDNTFSLPNGDIWSSEATGSEQVTRTLESDEHGVLMWSGAVPLAGYSFGPGKAQQTLTAHATVTKDTQASLSVNSATKMTVVIYDRKNDTYIFRTVDAASENLTRTANETSAETLFYLEDMCGMHLRLHEDAKLLVFDIDLGMGTSSQINDRFDLRQIWVNF